MHCIFLYIDKNLLVLRRRFHQIHKLYNHNFPQEIFYLWKWKWQTFINGSISFILAPGIAGTQQVHKLQH